MGEEDFALISSGHQRAQSGSGFPALEATLSATLKDEREETREGEADDSRNDRIQNSAGARVSLRGYRPVERLNDGSVARLGDLRLLELLGQQRHEHFLDLHVASQSHELESHHRNTSERHRKVAALSTPGLLGRRIPVLHLSQLAVHFVDAAPNRDDLRVCLGREVTHHLKLYLGSHDLALQTRRRLNRALGLLLEHDRSILLLKPPQGLFGGVEVDPRPRELARQEGSLARRLTGPVLRDELVQELDVVIRNRGGNRRVSVLDSDRDHPFPGGC